MIAHFWIVHRLVCLCLSSTYSVVLFTVCSVANMREYHFPVESVKDSGEVLERNLTTLIL